ncbi:MAG: hypothetical protein JWM74_206, partial [Myxococcaceae bacterium]|nr:hypothetical protein [Myxococcaceae bacterium]
MADPESSPDDRVGRFHRCIRDLAALNALPSMCIGRSPKETLEIILDALPTALGCDLVWLTLPGSPPAEWARLRGASLSDARIEALQQAMTVATDASAPLGIEGTDEMWCMTAEL